MTILAVPGFVQELRKFGRFDVEGCLNCGSCTVVCDLAKSNASFPRKPMQQALLGLKSSVDSSLEPWLCHDCGDCAVSCPRQSEPRESMMTLRRYLSSRYDLSGFTSRIYRSPVWELGALGFVATLVFALVVVYHVYYVDLSPGDFASTSMGLEHMFPLIEYFTYAVFFIPIAMMIANAVHMHRLTMLEVGVGRAPFRLYLTQAGMFFFHLFSHINLKYCSDEKHERRWIKHWLLGMSCTVMCVIPLFFLEWFQTDAIYPLDHPQRWLGYLATAAMIAVPLDILWRRMKKRGEHYKFSELSDLIFPMTLLLVAVTGIAVHIFRYAGWALSCHYAYAVHLASVVALVMVEMPFGKWSHVLYRPLALYFQSVREHAEAGAEDKEEILTPQESILKGSRPL
jgi:ferredoxin